MAGVHGEKLLCFGPLKYYFAVHIMQEDMTIIIDWYTQDDPSSMTSYIAIKLVS